MAARHRRRRRQLQRVDTQPTAGPRSGLRPGLVERLPRAGGSCRDGPAGTRCTEASRSIPRPTTVEEGSHMKFEHVIENPVADETVARVPIDRDDRVTPASPPRPAPDPRRPVSPRAGAWGLSLAVLITGTFMSVLDTSVVNVAM